MEDKPNLYRPKASETTKLYFMRCLDMGQNQWEQVSGPENIFAAVKLKLARMDHDAAYPVVFGKSVTIEVRYPNSAKVITFKCTGGFWPKYDCERQN